MDLIYKMEDDVFTCAYVYSSAFSLDISKSTATRRTKIFVPLLLVLNMLMLVLCVASLPLCLYMCFNVVVETRSQGKYYLTPPIRASYGLVTLWNVGYAAA